MLIIYIMYVFVLTLPEALSLGPPKLLLTLRQQLHYFYWQQCVRRRCKPRRCCIRRQCVKRLSVSPITIKKYFFAALEKSIM